MRYAFVVATTVAYSMVAGASAQTTQGSARAFNSTTGPVEVDTCTAPAIGQVICPITVKVRSVANWPRRCRVEVSPEVLIVKGVPVAWSRIQIAWTFDNATTNDYSFDSSIGIAIAEGLAPDVYSEPVESPLPLRSVAIRYLKSSRAAHNYNVHVMRKNSVGTWVACGIVDPLIVNTD